MFFFSSGVCVQGFVSVSFIHKFSVFSADRGIADNMTKYACLENALSSKISVSFDSSPVDK